MTTKEEALVNIVQDIQSRLRTGQFANEASVTQGAVLPILQAMGWPIFDAQMVCPEYTVERKRVDLALCHQPRRPDIFMEVKQVGKSEGADRQLFEYAFHTGVPMAVLTTGQEWHFYLPAEQGTYQDRRVYTLDLLEREPEECASRLIRYLSFARVAAGEWVEAAREDIRGLIRTREIHKTLLVAWWGLIEEPDELLVELIATKVGEVCGYKPYPDTVAQFLRELPRDSSGSPFVGSPARQGFPTGKAMLSQSRENLEIFLLEILSGSEWWQADIVRVLKERFGIKRDTARRALDKLAADGRVERARYGSRFKVRLNAGFL